MEERLARTISNLKNWDDLAQFEENARDKNRLTDEVSAAVNARSIQLGRVFIAEKTGLDLGDTSLAEERILQVVSEYVGIMRRQGKHPTRTLDQLRNRGLIGAVESSVCRATPTQGFQNLTEEGLEELSYEQIVLDHPGEFTARAVWFSRKTLGLPNEGHSPPTQADSDVQTSTAILIGWLNSAANDNSGLIPRFTNADSANVLGMTDMSRYGRVLGNIQSRIDFACYACGLPPLGLAADEPFAKSWQQQTRNWTFPVTAMQIAARSRKWAATDFDRILLETERLPGQAHISWKEALFKDEMKVKDWALGFNELSATLISEEKSKQNPRWSRDELILALELYLMHRESLPGKDSPEVIKLSEILNVMGQALGLVESETYRNPNGVYMKMNNFRRFDSEYTKDGRVGLSRGNKDEEVVWKEFSDDPNRLNIVAEAIRSTIELHARDNVLAGADEPEIQEAAEGRVLTRLHRVRERSQKLIESKKNSVIKKYGRLSCEACGFDFSEKYGPTGTGLIDVHHTKPVHTLSEGDITKLEDLVLLCANCHRVVHSSSHWLTVEQVKELIKH